MKIQCPCGAKYSFDVTPAMASEPIKFVCPQCGLDSSEVVNQLVQEQWAEQNLPAVPAPPSISLPPSKPAPARLKISHYEAPVAPPAGEPAPPPGGYVSKYCQRHSGILATEKCVVCDKPICPKCMEMFGYFCSPLCKNKADLQGIAAPEYAGQRFAVEKRFWRKTSSIFGSFFALLVVALGIWIWYAWFGSVPHTLFSVRFADDDRAYAGGALWQASAEASRAVVIAKSVQAREAPTDVAPMAAVLPAGSEVLAPETRGQWTYCTLPDGTRAWVPADALERVIPG